MSLNISYRSKDQLKLDKLHSEVKELVKINNALDILDNSIVVGDNASGKSCCLTNIKIASHTEGFIFCQNGYNCDNNSCNNQLFPEPSSASLFVRSLEEQLVGFSQKMAFAGIKDFRTRQVLRIINANLKKYYSTCNDKYLYIATNALIQFKGENSKQLRNTKIAIRIVVSEFFNHVIRDIRQVFRQMIRFLFKNLDADDDPIEILFKKYVKQNFVIKNNFRRYEFHRNNSISEYADRDGSNIKFTNKDRAVRNNRKIAKASFTGRAFSTYFSTGLTFGV